MGIQSTPSAASDGPIFEEQSSNNYDVVIVGAGMAGINAAYRLQTALPDYSYTILEGRSDVGGTWDLYRYPGIRSDSDLHTFGFTFAPWESKNPIGTGQMICDYIRSTANKFGIDKHFEFNHKVQGANWSSDAQQWSLQVENQGQRKTYNARFIILGTGYYNYNQPFEHVIPGLDKFQGTTVAPQFWPEDLDYKGKSIVVIGSGATAITLMPSLVDRGAGHVTMLQRSPAYVMSLPQKKPPFFRFLDLFVPRTWSQAIDRFRFLVIPYLFYLFCRTFPNASRTFLTNEAKKCLPKDYPMDPNFKPSYNPWDKRLCLCPDADFFKVFKTGKADIVTSTIKQVTATTIELDNGETLKPDIIVTATGLNLEFCGQIKLSVDRQPVAVPDTYMWRATMLSSVPNLFLIIGYPNTSWTLGSDCASRLLARVMVHLRKNNLSSATPEITEEEAKNPRSPFSLEATYMLDAARKMPHAGSTGVWRPRESYWKDNLTSNYADVREGLRFESVSA